MTEEVYEVVQRKGSVMEGMLWMLGLSLALFWMPFVGPLVAGFVGGRKAGSAGRAAMAVFMPGVVYAILAFLIGGLLDWLPLFGLITGLGAFVMSFVQIVPLLIGAVIGGSTAD